MLEDDEPCNFLAVGEADKRLHLHAGCSYRPPLHGRGDVPSAAAEFASPLCSGVNAITQDLRVLLLVCGLRRVKDPLYLLEAFSGEVAVPTL